MSDAQLEAKHEDERRRARLERARIAAYDKTDPLRRRGRKVDAELLQLKRRFFADKGAGYDGCEF